jgi:hypothetical protein
MNTPESVMATRSRVLNKRIARALEQMRDFQPKPLKVIQTVEERLDLDDWEWSDDSNGKPRWQNVALSGQN